MSNDLFPFIIYQVKYIYNITILALNTPQLHQAGVSNIPYNPVIHDLEVQPRPLNAEEIVAVLFDMYENILSGLFASFLPHIEGTKQSQ